MFFHFPGFLQLQPFPPFTCLFYPRTFPLFWMARLPSSTYIPSSKFFFLIFPTLTPDFFLISQNMASLSSTNSAHFCFQPPFPIPPFSSPFCFVSLLTSIT